MSQTKIKQLLRAGGMLIGLAVLVYALPVYAATGPQVVVGGGVQSAGNLGTVLKSTLVQISQINTFLHIALLVILQFLQYLLQADFFNDPRMMSGLYTIWQLSRDIMNVLFAVMLIGVSFYVIITAKSDMIKEKLMHFVIAVILVNFSWFFPRVIIDVANVVTATVYSIPNLLPQSTACKTLSGAANPTPVDCRVVTDVIIFPTKTEGGRGGTFCTAAVTGGGNPSCKCLDQIECHVEKDYTYALTNMTPSHAMINGLAVSFARITELAKVPTAAAGAGPIGTGQAVQISIQMAMSILMALAVQVAIVLPLIGLAIGLFIRIIILWVTTAFMPFAFLGVVKDGKIGTAIFGFETDIWKEFINAAFLPAMVGVPIAVGFIMLTTVSQIPVPTNMPFSFSAPLLSSVGSWWTMLWMFAAVGIIWTGSFKALAKSKITEKFTTPVKNFGESMFNGAIQLPLLTPIPLPGGKKGTVGSALNSMKNIPNIIGHSARTGQTFSQAQQAILGGGAPPGGITPANIDVLADRAKQNTKDIVTAINGLGGADHNIHLQTLQRVTETSTRSKQETFEVLREMMKSSKLAGSELDNQVLKDLVNHQVGQAGGNPHP